MKVGVQGVVGWEGLGGISLGGGKEGRGGVRGEEVGG